MFFGLQAGFVTLVVVTFFLSNGPRLFARLLIVFVMFVASILVFATIYLYLYKARPLHFLFNETIAQRQREFVESQGSAELAVLAKQTVLMSELLTALVENKATILAESAPHDVFLPSGVSYLFRHGPALPGGPPVGVRLSVLDSDGHALLEDCFVPYPQPPERTAEEFIKAANSAIRSFSRRSLELEQRIANVSSDEPKQLWSIWDFIYFSAIIQTTIGLGDILPNSTFVRCVVSVQVLFGYAILMVALNMVLTA